MVQPVDPAELHGHTEQALIEKIYIKAANDMLSSKMTELEGALAASKDVLDALKNLQNIKNQLSVANREVPNFSEDNYEDDAEDVFGEPIQPTLVDGFDYSLATNYASNLSDALNALLASVPPDQQTQLQSDPQSLYRLGQKVIEDISAAGSPEQWVLDNYDQDSDSETGSKAGGYQANLTLAVTAGESMNDAKKEEVRRILYVFEEYSKSAAAILNKITQLIENTARNISRS